jgi:hypothetical protein
MQLPDTKVFSYFLKTFGRPDREKTCECERTAEPSMSQVLHIANGETLNQKLAATNGIIAQLVTNRPAPERLIEDVCLASLARTPTSAESEHLLRALQEAKADDWRAAVEDVYWAFLSSREFLFNH